VSTAGTVDQRFGIEHATLQIAHGNACSHDLHDAASHHFH